MGLPGSDPGRLPRWADPNHRPACRLVESQARRTGSEERTWVAESAGRVVGFASTDPSRDPDATGGTGEVYAIYLEPDVVGTGVGGRLFAQAVEDLRQRGYRAATLWVLEGNARARRFYDTAGWRPDGTVTIDQMLGAELREVRYRIDFY